MHPAARFISAWFGPRASGNIFVASLPNPELRGTPAGEPNERHIITRSSERIADFTAKWDQPGRAVYWGPATLRPDASRRCKESIAELLALHIDIDFKNIEAAPEEIARIVEQLPLPPTRLRNTGHGFQAFWAFETAVAATPETVAEHERLQRLLADHLGGDRAAVDACHLMRMPGTTNSKGGDAIPVRELVANDVAYTVDALRAWLDSGEPPLIERKTDGKAAGNGASPDNPFSAFAAANGGEAPLDVERMLAEMVYLGPGGGGNAHDTLLRCSAALIRRGMPIDDVIAECLEALRTAAERSDAPFSEARERTIIEEMCAGAAKKFPPETGEHESTGPAGPSDAGSKPSEQTTAPWPMLPAAAYHGLAARVVETILPHTESDPAALLLQYLVSFGSVIGRSPFYLIEGAEHYPNLYALLVGQTAKARKGTSAQHIRRIMQIVEPEWARGNVVSGISSGEGIIHAIRDPIFTVKKGEEELADPGVDDKRLLIDEREFASALDSMRREGNVVSRIVRDAWDDPEVLRTLTKHSPTRVTRPFISIIGHITLEELRQKLDQNTAANGFANRFLFACVRRSKLLPHGGHLEQDAIDRLGAATCEAVATARAQTQVTMTPDAAHLWNRVYSQLSGGAPGLFGAVTARAEAQTLRLALLYALLERASYIEVAHLEAALAVWSYCEASARYVFGDLTGDPITDTILHDLRAAGIVGLSRWDISTRLGRHVPSNKIAAALMTLLTAGKVRQEKQSTLGRAREVWFAA